MMNASNTHDIPNRNVIPKTLMSSCLAVYLALVSLLLESYYHPDYHHQHNKVEDKYCQNGDQESTKMHRKNCRVVITLVWLSQSNCVESSSNYTVIQVINQEFSA